jgi:predicted HD phosphohydrolase
LRALLTASPLERLVKRVGGEPLPRADTDLGELAESVAQSVAHVKGLLRTSMRRLTERRAQLESHWAVARGGVVSAVFQPVADARRESLERTAAQLRNIDTSLERLEQHVRSVRSSVAQMRANVYARIFAVRDSAADVLRHACATTDWLQHTLSSGSAANGQLAASALPADIGHLAAAARSIARKLDAALQSRTEAYSRPALKRMADMDSMLTAFNESKRQRA